MGRPDMYRPDAPLRPPIGPKIFNAVADALNWHLRRKGIPEIYHYLDDFIIVAPYASNI